jgi:hypothetical protein
MWDEYSVLLPALRSFLLDHEGPQGRAFAASFLEIFWPVSAEGLAVLFLRDHPDSPEESPPVDLRVAEALSLATLHKVSRASAVRSVEDMRTLLCMSWIRTFSDVLRAQGDSPLCEECLLDHLTKIGSGQNDTLGWFSHLHHPLSASENRHQAHRDLFLRRLEGARRARQASRPIWQVVDRIDPTTQLGPKQLLFGAGVLALGALVAGVTPFPLPSLPSTSPWLELNRYEETVAEGQLLTVEPTPPRSAPSPPPASRRIHTSGASRTETRAQMESGSRQESVHTVSAPELVEDSPTRPRSLVVVRNEEEKAVESPRPGRTVSGIGSSAESDGVSMMRPQPSISLRADGGEAKDDGAPGSRPVISVAVPQGDDIPGQSGSPSRGGTLQRILVGRKYLDLPEPLVRAALEITKHLGGRCLAILDGQSYIVSAEGADLRLSGPKLDLRRAQALLSQVAQGDCQQ